MASFVCFGAGKSGERLEYFSTSWWILDIYGRCHKASCRLVTSNVDSNTGVIISADLILNVIMA